ncbi:hypothetical protein ACM74M_12075 [Pseudomonas aeruginosa]|uniref:hypothetical protein n=1 Tax=Pseudomonadaceae TaxID=135621 RepID=UPI00053D8239|nr:MULTISPECIES: hypothetical protein [Pseudomonadaceae]EJC9823102.1 hypothetical protein [Pseudomonas aeruginosa]EJN1406781.1 hypothetical protein [Pseudomonas aeruginosa]EJV1461236.1 hypothetical protein [Pseudomonas aeruginosa]EKU3710570.1 hypothetical protein [Pseudomonas aeruginosa]EKU8505780.1 hypothetical protein [Pseudomonas aeruginosa]
MTTPVTSISNALTALASAPLAQAAPETLIEVALLVWYDPDPLPSLKRTLDALEGIQQRRARFALDVIRRYPCIELERQRALRDLVDLKVSFEGGSMVDLLNAWDLDETETPNTKAILPYQTRHYADERRKQASRTRLPR